MRAEDAADRIDEPSARESAWTLPIDECGNVSGERTHDAWTGSESDQKQGPEKEKRDDSDVAVRESA